MELRAYLPYLSALGDPKIPSVHRDGARVEAAEITPDMATIPGPVTATPGLLSQRTEAASVGTAEPGLQSRARNLNPLIDLLKSPETQSHSSVQKSFERRPGDRDGPWLASPSFLGLWKETLTLPRPHGQGQETHRQLHKEEWARVGPLSCLCVVEPLPPLLIRSWGWKSQTR